MNFFKKIGLDFDLVLAMYGSKLQILWDNHILLMHAIIIECTKTLTVSVFE